MRQQFARVLGRLSVAALVASAVAVVVPTAGPASAASLTSPPTRLYMAPTGTTLVAGLLGVPIGSMTFTGSDIISMQDRALVVVAEDGAGDCVLDATTNWDIGPCSRIQMDVTHGLIEIGPATTEFRDDSNGDPDPTDPVYLLAGGAVIDSITNPPDNPSLSIQINGTQDQLNAALMNLQYTPDTDYFYNGSNPETLHIVVTSGAGAGNVTRDVDIKVLDVNDFPDLGAPAGPIDAVPGIETVITGFTAADEDNDEDVDGMQATPPVPGDDPIDGSGNNILLVGILDCGQAVAPNQGFHFRGGTFEADDMDIESTLQDLYDIVGNPLLEQAADALIAVIDAIDPSYKNIPLQTSAVTDYTTAWAGIGNMSDVQYALSQVSFLHGAENDSCDLITIISDLGNNGLPLQYVGAPPSGFEIPFVGADFDELTINTGGLLEVDASFTAPTFTLEGDTSVATITITPAVHPAFSLTAATADGTADSVDDYGARSSLTVTVPEDATSVTVDTNTLNDVDPEPDQTFTWSIVPRAPIPAGWEITTNNPVGLVTIIDDDDAPKSVTSVSSPTVAEGLSGTTTLTYTLTLSGPADGNEVVSVATADGSATDADNDYEPLAAGTTVTFATGATTATVGVVVNGDGVVEPGETVGLTLTSDPLLVTIDPAASSAVGTILNDDTNPAVTIEQAVGQADPTNTPPIVFTATFDRPVTGFIATDVDLTGSTAGGILTPMVTGGPSVYTVTVAGMTTPGTVIASIPAGAAMDASNNVSAAATFVDHTVTWDAAPPAPTITLGPGQTDPTSATPIVFTVTFDEPVAGFTSADVSTATSTATGTLVDAVTGSGAVYTVSVSGMDADGTVVITFPAGAAVDLAGNASLAFVLGDNSVDWVKPVGDVTPPSAVIDQAVGQPDPTNVSPIHFTVTFSEPVAGFVGTDVSFTGSTAGGTLAATVTGGPTIFDVSVEGMTLSGTVVASVPAGAATDASLNPSTVATSTDNTVTWDVLSPAVTIDQAVGQVDPAVTAPILFTAVFSEGVTGFTGTDLSFAGSTAGGTLTAAVSGGPTVYTVSVNGMTTPGNVVASIPAGVALDAAGNGNAVATWTDHIVAWPGIVDSTAPTVTIDRAPGQADPTSTAPIVFAVTFDEPVTGFDLTDVSLAASTAGGTLVAAVAGSGATYTITVTGMDGDGDVTADVATAAAVDAASNPSGAVTVVDDTVAWIKPVGDVTPPGVSIDRGVGQTDTTSVTPIVFTVTFTEPVTGFTADDVSLAASTAGGVLVAAVSGAGATYTVSVSGMTTSGTVQADVVTGAAQDSALNVSTAVVVVDNTVAWIQPPPLTITVPSAIVRPNDPGQAGAIVAYPAVTAAGGVPPITIGCNRASGTFYPLGTTTVSCTATDAVGASLQTFVTVSGQAIVTATFTITVNDVEPPVIADNPDRTTGATGGTTPVAFGLPAASDNSGVPPTVACSPPSGTGFTLGMSTVTCTATDQAGNQASSAFVVNVISSGALPATGSDPTDTMRWGGLLLLVGAVTLVAGRRRRLSC